MLENGQPPQPQDDLQTSKQEIIPTDTALTSFVQSAQPSRLVSHPRMQKLLPQPSLPIPLPIRLPNSKRTQPTRARERTLEQQDTYLNQTGGPLGRQGRQWEARHRLSRADEKDAPIRHVECVEQASPDSLRPSTHLRRRVSARRDALCHCQDHILPTHKSVLYAQHSTHAQSNQAMARAAWFQVHSKKIHMDRNNKEQKASQQPAL